MKPKILDIIANKAEDSAVLHLSGNEEVEGTKNFITAPKIANINIPSDTDTVHKSGDETINGTKTFSSKINGNLQGTADISSKLGTATVGATNKPIYLNEGTATAISGNIGDSNTPVYVSDGTLTSTGKSFASYLPLAGGTITGGIKQYVVAISASDINLSSGNTFTKTITANTTFTISNPGASSVFSLILTNGGNYTVTWPSSVKWENGEKPELSSNGTDCITFITYNSGTTWIGVTSSLNIQ